MLSAGESRDAAKKKAMEVIARLREMRLRKAAELVEQSVDETLERPLGAVRLLDDISAFKAPHECHGCHMNGSHLGRQHGFNFIPWIP